ncbi:MAG TPA: M3 family oligoendopeptidase [Clostridiales bacterium]|nr:M3 family oligoendopeptidase [Clostridiales bacterium]
MNKEWSLDLLYKSFQDESFSSDIKSLEDLIQTFKDFVKGLNVNDPNKEIPNLINYMENIYILANKLGDYVSLRQSTDTKDSETISFMQKLEELMSNISKEEAIVKKYIANTYKLDEIIKDDPKLTEYEFFLKEIKIEAEHTLDDEVEEVVAKMNLSAGSAWSSMHQYLTSILDVDYKEKTITLSEIRNLAHDKDANTRRLAYEKEIASYEKINDSIAFSLNNIKSQVNMLSNMRAYKSPLDMTLQESRMKRETLDAMLTAIKDYLPRFHAYLRRKGEILGSRTGLPWWDLFAPLGETNKTFTIEEAKEYLTSHFRPFSNDLADLTIEAFDNNWIDFLPRSGKVGGAFCSNLPYIKESRILTNFNGSLSDVVTLAHELGHAYHGLHIQDHLPLNTDYSMPVAETASNFNETLIMNAAINEAKGNEKLTLLESQLQDTTQIICDIYSRFLFESEVFEKRRETFLFSDDLKEIMINTQKEAYGDGLDHNYLHPYMWINKSHYYSESLSYYNFPYAFGGLFAKGLYAKYLEQGPDFVPQYHSLLKATTVNTVEDVAEIAGIDLSKPDFWRQSLQTISGSINEFLKITK